MKNTTLAPLVLDTVAHGFTQVQDFGGASAESILAADQPRARADFDGLTARLGRYTKADLTALLTSAGIPVYKGSTKADLVCRAHIAQMAAWWPRRSLVETGKTGSEGGRELAEHVDGKATGARFWRLADGKVVPE